MDNLAEVLLIAHIMDVEEQYALRLERRILRDNSNPLSLPEGIFRGIYRLSRDTAHDLVEQLLPHMRLTVRNTSISNYNKIFVGLQFFAQGSYQKAVGQDHYLSMSQSSVSRCISEVARVMLTQGHIIEFPDTEIKLNREKQKFVNMPNGFPGIIGAIDCTHVLISSPPVDDQDYPAAVFLNRKGEYSINVQVIVGADLRILAVNARFPGSVHDAAVWLSSNIRDHLLRKYANGDRNYWLIGDSGYPLEPWLMVPFSGPNLTQAQVNFNAAHRSTRNVIERLNGVWKARFRCLLKHRTLHYHPIAASNIINACAVLHNFCYLRGDEENDCNILEEGDGLYCSTKPTTHLSPTLMILDGPAVIPAADEELHLLNEGRIVRNRIVQQYFN